MKASSSEVIFAPWRILRVEIGPALPTLYQAGNLMAESSHSLQSKTIKDTTS